MLWGNPKREGPAQSTQFQQHQLFSFYKWGISWRTNIPNKAKNINVRPFQKQLRYTD